MEYHARSSNTERQLRGMSMEYHTRSSNTPLY